MKVSWLCVEDQTHHRSVLDLALQKLLGIPTFPERLLRTMSQLKQMMQDSDLDTSPCSPCNGTGL